jgi:hypothetical protein
MVGVTEASNSGRMGFAQNILPHFRCLIQMRGFVAWHSACSSQIVMNVIGRRIFLSKDGIMKKLLVIVLSTVVLSLISACGSSNNSGGATPVAAAPDTTPDKPYVTHRGARPWQHWNAPAFNRPTYNWHSDRVKNVTCDARDSRGNSYVVVEGDYKGLEYQAVIGQIQDAALDRCYAHSHDTGCRFQDCTPGY